MHADCGDRRERDAYRTRLVKEYQDNDGRGYRDRKGTDAYK